MQCWALSPEIQSIGRKETSKTWNKESTHLKSHLPQNLCNNQEQYALSQKSHQTPVMCIQFDETLRTEKFQVWGDNNEKLSKWRYERGPLQKMTSFLPDWRLGFNFVSYLHPMLGADSSSIEINSLTNRFAKIDWSGADECNFATILSLFVFKKQRFLQRFVDEVCRGSVIIFMYST